MSKKLSCHGCLYHSNEYCTWFPKWKVIPENILDKGCKFVVPKIKEVTGDSTLKHLIDIFEGEIISIFNYETKEDRSNWTRTYKEKNKYSERKDW